MSSVFCYLIMWICVPHLIISNMMISNDLMENFVWKTEDWGKNRSLSLLIFITFFQNQNKPWQRLEHYITLPISVRGKAAKQRQIVTDFWDNFSQKDPLWELCHNRKKNWLFLLAFLCIHIFWWHHSVSFALRGHQLTIFALDFNLPGFF